MAGQRQHRLSIRREGLALDRLHAGRAARDEQQIWIAPVFDNVALDP